MKLSRLLGGAVGLVLVMSFVMPVHAQNNRDHKSNHERKDHKVDAQGVSRFDGKLKALKHLITVISARLTKAEAFGLKLKTRIEALTAAGKDTTVLQHKYSEYVAKLNSAKAKIEAVKAVTLKLTVADLDANKHVFKELREDLKSTFADLRSAHKIAKQIVEELGKL